VFILGAFITPLLFAATIWALPEVNCGMDSASQGYQTMDIPLRGTLRAVMVWAGVWDTVNNVGACPGMADSFYSPSPNAPYYYRDYFDSNWDRVQAGIYKIGGK
jgi:hypothetical protein